MAYKKRVLVVCGPSYNFLKNTKKTIEAHKDIFYFNNFKPNPIYESVVEGIKLYKQKKCDAVIAVGGGSAIDVAKCIKLFNSMDLNKNYLKQEIVDNSIPTTAGTGSEATRYAVIYYKGEKQSVTSDYCVPQTVILDPDNLITIPEYQRKATMMDALAHALESMWSIKSTTQSMEYSVKALELFVENREGYLKNTKQGNFGMQMAAYFAGKAINITQTTAGHARCYRITSVCGCAHGHAAMLCKKELFPWRVENIEKCIDTRGKSFLNSVFNKIAQVLGTTNVEKAIKIIKGYFDSNLLDIPYVTEKQVCEMTINVNKERLKNNPITINQEDINRLYHRILRVKG